MAEATFQIQQADRHKMAVDQVLIEVARDLMEQMVKAAEAAEWVSVVLHQMVQEAQVL